jgi:hypothetical protein
MQINRPKNIIAAVAVTAAFCAPAAAQAKGGHGHSGEHGHGHAVQHLPQAPKTRNVIVKGTVVAVDGNFVTVAVAGSNHHGRALKGQEIQLDLAAARIRVKDVNGDGARDAADVVAGDRVLAQVRVPRQTTLDLSQPFAARKLIDVGPVPTTDSTDDDEQPEA